MRTIKSLLLCLPILISAACVPLPAPVGVNPGSSVAAQNELSDSAAARMTPPVTADGRSPKASWANMPVSPDVIRFEIHQGMAWLLDHEKNHGTANLESLVALRDMNVNFCHDRGIGDDITQAIAKMGPSITYWRRLLDGSKDYAYPKDELFRRVDGLYDNDSLLIMTLYCDLHRLPASAEDQLFNVDLSSGANLYSRFLGMTFLSVLGCKNSQKDARFRETFRTAAERVAIEQDSLTHDGNYDARIAVLELAGYPDLVKREWIGDISSRQLASGAWPARDGDPGTPDADATVKALWALVRYQEECPIYRVNGQ